MVFYYAHNTLEFVSVSITTTRNRHLVCHPVFDKWSCYKQVLQIETLKASLKLIPTISLRILQVIRSLYFAHVPYKLPKNNNASVICLIDLVAIAM